MVKRFHFLERITDQAERLLPGRLQFILCGGLHVFRLLDGRLVLAAVEPGEVDRDSGHYFAGGLGSVVVPAGFHSRLAAASFASAASIFLRAINSSGRLVRARFCNGVNSKPSMAGRSSSGCGSGDWAGRFMTTLSCDSESEICRKISARASWSLAKSVSAMRTSDCDLDPASYFARLI